MSQPDVNTRGRAAVAKTLEYAYDDYAVALLAHFYASPAATDLCYEARIGKDTCRPLAQSSRKPLPLARSG